MSFLVCLIVVSPMHSRLLAVLLLFYGCTVVQDQCTIYTLYYFITSLPVYPHIVHGHCPTVVLLDTSNSVYCIATLMECTVQCTASRPY
jgi:hypothetical protein